MVDSLDSGSSVHSGRAGSNPASRTKSQCESVHTGFFLWLFSLAFFFRSADDPAEFLRCPADDPAEFLRCPAGTDLNLFVPKIAPFSSKPISFVIARRARAPDAAILNGTRRHPGTKHGKARAMIYSRRLYNG